MNITPTETFVGWHIDGSTNKKILIIQTSKQDQQILYVNIIISSQVTIIFVATFEIFMTICSKQFNIALCLKIISFMTKLDLISIIQTLLHQARNGSWCWTLWSCKSAGDTRIPKKVQKIFLHGYVAMDETWVLHRTPESNRRSQSGEQPTNLPQNAQNGWARALLHLLPLKRPDNQ